ncbi:uncharacterized protein LOC129960404 [Argiope bruennichi]|uniref:uncharacterized protein LOC129960404 n=1 Tax=Argiope bruennichi TaxID=94029 RepID=UPI002495978B|nr:uncharacterized protein LOC129960404 [Argiope bruennichi]
MHQGPADILLTPPDTNKYDALKTRLIAEFSASENEQIRRLLSELHLGADKPSQLLRKMRELGGCTGIKDDFLKTLWLQRLPSEIQAILSISSEPLDNLANMADKIAEVRISSADSSAFARSFSRGRSGDRGRKFCYYHARFGEKALKCVSPCSYSTNADPENSQ